MGDSFNPNTYDDTFIADLVAFVAADEFQSMFESFFINFALEFTDDEEHSLRYCLVSPLRAQPRSRIDTGRLTFPSLLMYALTQVHGDLPGVPGNVRRTAPHVLPPEGLPNQPYFIRT